MSGKTKIEWTDRTWNPLTGCTKVSPGCDNCYAKTMHERFHGPGTFDTITLHPERLDQPLRWRKPSRVFVNSMSDLFHEDVPDDYISRVFDVMAAADRHTFQVLTKRHARMRSFVTRYTAGGMPPNVWLGVSVENQQWADIRIPALLATPAAVRFLSCEPLLGPLGLARWTVPAAPRIDWVIAWRRIRSRCPPDGARLGAVTARPVRRRKRAVPLQTVGSVGRHGTPRRQESRGPRTGWPHLVGVPPMTLPRHAIPTGTATPSTPVRTVATTYRLRQNKCPAGAASTRPGGTDQTGIGLRT